MLTLAHSGVYNQQKINLVLVQPYMDNIKNKCHSCRSNSCIIQLGRCYCCNDDTDDATSSISLSAIGSSKLRWKVLWMKLKKEKKKKLFESASFRAPYYDPYTYSQNFDHGTAKDEPEYHSRSFSARFADPSGVILRKSVV